VSFRREQAVSKDEVPGAASVAQSGKDVCRMLSATTVVILGFRR
jgi:hypothetical protein